MPFARATLYTAPRRTSVDLSTFSVGFCAADGFCSTPPTLTPLITLANGDAGADWYSLCAPLIASGAAACGELLSAAGGTAGFGGSTYSEILVQPLKVPGLLVNAVCPFGPAQR